TDEERMGLGFVFMQSFMDEVKVETKPGNGTKVILIKRLQPLAGPPN
ncbi:MAG TPA: anti-sigma F factor, partial [Clostridia bacterium]|nr:anti-sigma F factor [Clostridia bacterium]